MSILEGTPRDFGARPPRAWAADERGGLRFGRGPVFGTRREEVVLGLVRIGGPRGGGMRPDEGFGGGAMSPDEAGFGGGAMRPADGEGEDALAGLGGGGIMFVDGDNEGAAAR